MAAIAPRASACEKPSTIPRPMWTALNTDTHTMCPSSLFNVFSTSDDKTAAAERDPLSHLVLSLTLLAYPSFSPSYVRQRAHSLSLPLMPRGFLVVRLFAKPLFLSPTHTDQQYSTVAALVTFLSLLHFRNCVSALSLLSLGESAASIYQQQQQNTKPRGIRHNRPPPTPPTTSPRAERSSIVGLPPLPSSLPPSLLSLSSLLSLLSLLARCYLQLSQPPSSQQEEEDEERERRGEFGVVVGEKRQQHTHTFPGAIQLQRFENKDRTRT